MKCPVCNSELFAVKYHGLIVDTCKRCGGIWFDPDELRFYIDFFLQDNPDLPPPPINHNKKTLPVVQSPDYQKLCPRCGVPMRMFNYACDSNIILDKCPRCDGIWTDGGEVKQLAQFVKGNPHLDALGKALAEHTKKLDAIKDWTVLSRDFSQSAGYKVFLPKIILPIASEPLTLVVPKVVFAIILINVAIFTYQSFYVEDIVRFFYQYGLIPRVVASGKQYYRFLSSMFIHRDLVHLLGNMFFFWIFAHNVEARFGHFRFLLFYLLFGLCGSWLDVFTRIHSSVPAIGSSGAISGLMGAYLVLFPRSKITTLIINQAIRVPAFLYLGVWILWQILFGMLYASASFSPPVSWFAHIGGFMSGVVVAGLFRALQKKHGEPDSPFPQIIRGLH
ncbi:rhomboid family intramembrane serine protease [Candidatus Sumerlaeota bacterium]|nr:rhomboid family intramembrane serine protease [Candidatus Sumerlaeota bacterium]